MDRNSTGPVLESRTAGYQASDAFTIYLREIGTIKLLSPTEEANLARRVQAGDEEARQQMIKANLRLVVKIAREYAAYGMPLLDLISEGNIGLMKAVERFDPGKGARLSTYAACWIKQAIRNALLRQSKTIRLPAHVTASLFKLRRTASALTLELGREPTDEELASRLSLTPAQVRRLRIAAAPMASIDTPIREEKDSEAFADLLEDEQADTPYELLVRKTDAATLRRMLTKLPEREATVLRLRFGLNGREPMTLEAIGAKFGVTRERIRQVESIALKHLREVWPNSHKAAA